MSKASLAREQAAPLKEIANKVEAIFNVTKLMAKYPNIDFTALESAWISLKANGVSVPAKMEAKASLKFIEKEINAESACDDIFPLISINAPSGNPKPAWGIFGIGDEGLKAETCSEAANKLFAKYFSYRLPKQVTEETAKKTAEEPAQRNVRAQLPNCPFEGRVGRKRGGGTQDEDVVSPPETGDFEPLDPGPWTLDSIPHSPPPPLSPPVRRQAPGHQGGREGRGYVWLNTRGVHAQVQQGGSPSVHEG